MAVKREQKNNWQTSKEVAWRHPRGVPEKPTDTQKWRNMVDVYIQDGIKTDGWEAEEGKILTFNL